MPAENLEEEGLPKNPNLHLAQLKFLLSLEDHKADKDARDKLMQAITEKRMAPFYKEVCRDLRWTVDEPYLKSLDDKNTEDLKKLNDTIEDAEQNLGETEVRDAMLAKAEYLCQIGDKENSLSAFRKVYDKTIALGHRMDIVFHLIRIGLFYMDNDLITRNIDKAKSLMEEGGDWDRRNRLKVYNGLYCASVRDFKGVADNFLETVSTFTSYELMEYKDFVKYVVFCSMIALDRQMLREKVVKGSEILEVLHGLPIVRDYLFSMYDRHYAQFFMRLAQVEEMLKTDRIFARHYKFYTREMRIIAYNQLLQSYQSLTLQYMADTFGVSKDFIDAELSRFIAAGRLHCKIDKVDGIVETTRPDSKNYQYQAAIKQGDMLLNRIQKLSRVINL